MCFVDKTKGEHSRQPYQKKQSNADNEMSTNWNPNSHMSINGLSL